MFRLIYKQFDALQELRQELPFSSAEFKQMIIRTSLQRLHDTTIAVNFESFGQWIKNHTHCFTLKFASNWDHNFVLR